MNFANFLQGIVAVIWVVVVAMVVLVIVRASRGRQTKGLTTVILIAVALAVVLTTVSAGLVFIQPEERGFVISAISPEGYRKVALQPGLRWIIPYFERVVIYDISRQSYTMSIAPLEGMIVGDDSIAARTSDGQEIFVDASVIYSIDPDRVVQLHIEWQKRYTNELVRPLARGVIRDAVSQFGVEEVVTTKRFDMAQQINTAMTAKMQENGLLLSEFVLRNITFSPEYAASVEQKQIAEQLAQQAFFVVEQRKQEAQQAIETARGQAESVIIRAEGDASALIVRANAEAEARLIQADAEAQALKVIAASLRNNPDLLTYQYITKLSAGIQVMLVPNDTPYLLPLPTLEPGVTVP